MKRLFLILTATAIMSSLSSVAQEQTTKQEQTAKLLTTTDVVLNRELSPKNLHIQWIGESDCYATTQEDAIIATDARTGKSRTLITKQEIDALMGEDSFMAMPRYAFDEEGNFIPFLNRENNSSSLMPTSQQIYSNYQRPYLSFLYYSAFLQKLLLM